MTGMLMPGTVFAGYVVDRVLGTGGMGAVYVVRHPRLPRRDALKVLSAEYSASGEFRARFIREAELAARLDHPNIVAVHDRGVEHGRLWIAMRFVDGSDASALIRGGPEQRPPGRILHIVTEAARGLDEAHRTGLLHRDVKPANILLEIRPGQPDRVLVSDFGIAKAAAGATALTADGTVLATLAYAAPEQLTGQVVDRRADVYALGCTAFELLTGVKPFDRANPGALMVAHLYETPSRASDLVPALSPAVDAVLGRALAKDPGDRHPSCGALAADLALALGLPGSDTAPTVTGATVRIRDTPPRGSNAEQPTTRVRRPRFGIARVVTTVLAAVAVASIAVGIVVQQRGSAGGTDPSVVVPTTPVRTWGSHDYIAQALPKLLPADQDATGYQGIRCVAVDEDRRPADIAAPAVGVNRLSCNGSKDPVEQLIAGCRADRSAADGESHLDSKTVVSSDELWERRSGSGRLVFGDVARSSGGTIGALSVTFTDTRRFCWVTVYGGTSGTDLRDRWWTGAPL